MKKNLFSAALLLLALLLAVDAHAGYFEQGSRYYVYRNYAKAREMFLKAVEASNDGNAYYFLGEIEKNDKNFEKAVEYYQLAVKGRINRKYYNLAYWNVIVLTEQTGDYMGMVRFCRELYDRTGDGGAKTKVESVINKFLWTDNEEAKQSYNRGIELKKAESFDEAESAFREALSRESSFLAPQFELGLAELRKGSSGEALRHFARVADHIPFYGEVHLLMGDIYFQREAYRDAAFHLERAMETSFLDKNSRYQVYIKSATAQYNTRNFEKAKEHLASALKLNAASRDALLMLSAINIREENYREALATLQKAHKLDPDDTEVIFQTGSIHYRLGDARHTAEFDRLFDLTEGESDKPQKYHRAFDILAKHHFQARNYARADKIMNALPEGARTHEQNLMRARASYHLGDYEEAIRRYDRLSPGGDEDRYILCLLYAKTGRTERARDILTGLVSIETYRTKASKEPALSKILAQIEEEAKAKSGETRN
ncbi:MAG TPA: tetratricopeptide repeat protein [Spirochaetota bacterium]|nr:tetratricopeptide repeat protein [Spirochaetota bacterium]